jgi:hypothetical protein
MRGIGDFPQMQFRLTDPRMNELFDYLRKAVDVLEQIRPHIAGNSRSPSSTCRSRQAQGGLCPRLQRPHASRRKTI